MIDIDQTMLVQIANILILIVIMNAVLYRPIRNILKERRDRLAALRKDVETFNRNAELRVEEFDQKMQSARMKAKEELEQARTAAKNAGNETLGAVRQKADAEKTDQMTNIKTELAAAKQQLQGQIADFANDMAVKILGRAL
jgi:F-type H+-transporting ATPase subunit b